ncbi:hypothetical protein CBS101457_003216 [Exobasidium rhododendri]|nr:hypothetical protein CBS101457_003216 [Exobasidium rhododendri]
MFSTLIVRGVLLSFLAVSAVLAQVTPSISTDPLAGSTFTTPFYSPSATFTYTSTFPSAASKTLVTISGTAGPSPATGSYAFTYSAPVVSQTATPLSSLYSSLAAAGEPTAFTSAFQPDTGNGFQIVDSASSIQQSLQAVVFTAIFGAVVGAFYL